MLALGTKHWFTPADGRCSYEIRALSGVEYLEIQEITDRELSDEELARLAAGKRGLPAVAMEKCLIYGVSNWRDVYGEDEQPLEFRRELITQIPYVHMAELAAEITTKSLLTEEQEKNLSSQSKSPPTGKSSIARRARGAGTARKKTRQATASTS